MNAVRDFLEFHFRFDMSLCALKPHSKRGVQESNDKLVKILEKLASFEYKPIPESDRTDIYRRFMEAVKNGKIGCLEAFASSRDKKKLISVLTYIPPKKTAQGDTQPVERPIAGVPFFLTIALDIIADGLRVSRFRVLCMAYLHYWAEFPVTAKNTLSKWIKDKNKELRASYDNKRLLDFEQNKRFLFFGVSGLSDLCKELWKRGKNTVMAFFEAKNCAPDNSLPFFLTFSNARDFLFEVFLLSLSDPQSKRDSKKDFLSIIEKNADSKLLTRDHVLRVLVKYVYFDELKERIKSLALRSIGDPKDSSKWKEWTGASEQDKEDVEILRKKVNLWILENVMALFFDVLFDDSERHDFWKPYISCMDNIRIFCTLKERISLKKDERFSEEMSSHFGRLTDNSHAVLMMEIKEYVLIEVSAGGNALYVYRKGNLKKYGLDKLSRALEMDTKEQLKVEEFKDTSLPIIKNSDSFSAEEGRFYHRGYWQENLKRWLSSSLDIVPKSNSRNGGQIQYGG
ncbi:MAG: hypothetical protein LBO82_02055 [Synergistaceae bacterium]|jgi:hypothetical protein|nr:hypothetical protein [Synergistaceae bacterium]